MFIIPLRTDRRLRSQPWVTHVIILVNIAVFAFTFNKIDDSWEYVYRFLLDPQKPHAYQYVTHLFLHQNVSHLIINMFFLYTFGGSVEDRLGKLGFAVFYVLGGVATAAGYMFFDTPPIGGAAGAVCAVTGAYMALCPRAKLTAFYFVVFSLGVFEVRSTIVVLFQIGLDMFLAIMGSRSQFIYAAHVCGYAAGFLSCVAMLKTGLLSREPFDMLTLIQQRRRRHSLRETKLTQQDIGPWVNPGRQSDASDPLHAPPTVQQIEIINLRTRILDKLMSQRFDEAVDDYSTLLEMDPAQVMSRQQQFDLANQLMARGNHRTAAKAYELFLTVYRSDIQKNQVELMLALIYTRYIRRPARAHELLQTIMPRISDRDQLELAQVLQAELAANEGSAGP